MGRVYAGLDVSDKSTHVCVLDGDGGLVWRGVCATDPDVVAKTLERHAGALERVVLETGALSAFLYHGLIERDVPAICICARHAKRALAARVNKSDEHDAEGLAQLARTGWFKAVRIKDSATHLDRAELKVREQLVRSHGAMLSQLRSSGDSASIRFPTVATGTLKRSGHAFITETEPMHCQWPPSPRLAPGAQPRYIMRNARPMLGERDMPEIWDGTSTTHARSFRTCHRKPRRISQSPAHPSPEHPQRPSRIQER